MNLPTVGDAITKGRVQRTNRKTIPEVSVGIVEQWVRAEPEVFAHGVDGTVGALSLIHI